MRLIYTLHVDLNAKRHNGALCRQSTHRIMRRVSAIRVRHTWITFTISPYLHFNSIMHFIAFDAKITLKFL